MFEIPTYQNISTIYSCRCNMLGICKTCFSYNFFVYISLSKFISVLR